MKSVKSQVWSKIFNLLKLFELFFEKSPIIHSSLKRLFTRISPRFRLFGSKQKGKKVLKNIREECRVTLEEI